MLKMDEIATLDVGSLGPSKVEIATDIYLKYGRNLMMKEDYVGLIKSSKICEKQ